MTINRKLRCGLGVAALITTALLISAGSSLADPPDTLISPPNHRHFIVTPDGRYRWGRNLREPELQQAFNAFHYNVHHSEVPGIGDIPTLGPRTGAGVAQRRGRRGDRCARLRVTTGAARTEQPFSSRFAVAAKPPWARATPDGRRSSDCQP